MKPRLALVVSAEITLRAFMLGHLRAWQSTFDLTVMANGAAPDLLPGQGIQAQLLDMPIERPVRPLADFVALIRLWRALRRGRFDLVFSVTPKAGLLAMAAAWLAQVPVRVHVFTGQVWVTRSGPSRYILKSIDRLTAWMATHVLVDGKPQRQFLISEGVLRADKSQVLGSGSLSGVDAKRFTPDPLARVAIRDALGVPADALVFLYMGRLNRDKGVLDLAQAFAQLGQSSPSTHLLLVGPDEAGMRPLVQETCAACSAQLHFVGYTDQPQRYIAAADVFCLPSYREGFPTSVIEAAASGIPTIASRIYGIADAVLEEETGLMHLPGRSDEIFACMRRMLESPEQRILLGNNARQRASLQFSAEQVTKALADYLIAHMNEANETRL
ncbi:MAG: N-diacetylbacillosaminyl-diphospho-undecaprenol alpha,3-N-acetylgalactosaminyltransferase [Rhodocyclales bacterium]|nr:N-diacetylbacillosaminyl-diphospho-undecaprenol alpha,3-N-acetylgalactosaminyltransferase [Rhodocyclales bacterium]